MDEGSGTVFRSKVAEKELDPTMKGRGRVTPDQVKMISEPETTLVNPPFANESVRGVSTSPAKAESVKFSWNGPLPKGSVLNKMDSCGPESAKSTCIYPAPKEQNCAVGEIVSVGGVQNGVHGIPLNWFVLSGGKNRSADTVVPSSGPPRAARHRIQPTGTMKSFIISALPGK